MTRAGMAGCWPTLGPVWPDDREDPSGRAFGHGTRPKVSRAGAVARGAAPGCRARPPARTGAPNIWTSTRAGMEVYRELVPLARDFENELLKLLAGPDAEAPAQGAGALEEVLLKKRDPS